MKHTLHEIAQEFRERLELIGDLDAENEDVMAALDSIQAPMAHKVRNVLLYVQNIEAVAAARLEAAARLLAGGKTLMARAESMRSYVHACVSASGVKLPLVFPEFTVNLAKLPPACEVTVPVEQLDPDYVKTTITISGTSRKVKAMLEDLAKVGATREADATDVKTEIEHAPMKREILSDLKEGVIIEGARVSPTGYRLTVK